MKNPNPTRPTLVKFYLDGHSVVGIMKFPGKTRHKGVMYDTPYSFHAHYTEDLIEEAMAAHGLTIADISVETGPDRIHPNKSPHDDPRR